MSRICFQRAFRTLSFKEVHCASSVDGTLPKIETNTRNHENHHEKEPRQRHRTHYFSASSFRASRESCISKRRRANSSSAFNHSISAGISKLSISSTRASTAAILKASIPISTAFNCRFATIRSFRYRNATCGWCW